jgi:hypothetical protein
MREPGYYWGQYSGELCIAQYTYIGSHNWWLAGDSGAYHEDEFDWVSDTPLTPPEK